MAQHLGAKYLDDLHEKIMDQIMKAIRDGKSVSKTIRPLLHDGVVEAYTRGRENERLAAEDYFSRCFVKR